jgi:hypothetical protein
MTRAIVDSVDSVDSAVDTLLNNTLGNLLDD